MKDFKFPIRKNGVCNYPSATPKSTYACEGEIEGLGYWEQINQ